MSFLPWFTLNVVSIFKRNVWVCIKFWLVMTSLSTTPCAVYALFPSVHCIHDFWKEHHLCKEKEYRVRQKKQDRSINLNVFFSSSTSHCSDRSSSVALMICFNLVWQNGGFLSCPSLMPGVWLEWQSSSEHLSAQIDFVAPWGADMLHLTGRWLWAVCLPC